MSKEDWKAYVLYAIFAAAILLALALSGCGARCYTKCIDAAINSHVDEVRSLRCREELTAEEKAGIMPSHEIILIMDRSLCRVRCGE